jgi:hypothetical protein
MSSNNEVPPLWLEAIRRLERAVGVPVESAVRSDAYFEVVTQANRVRARMTKSFEDVTEQWLHLFNMPAASEVRRLREQLARVERQVNRVAKGLTDREEAPKPRPRAKPKPKPRANGRKPRTP